MSLAVILTAQADGSAEPAIPWDAYLFPDGTPVSYTEAAVMRNWTQGVSDFIAFDDFLPNTHLFVGDSFLCLQPGQAYFPSLRGGADGSRVLAETTVWLNATTGGGLLVQALPGNATANISGYFAGWRSGGPHSLLTLELWDAGVTTLASFNMTQLDCGLVAGWNMLRVVAEGPLISVYANPMFPDALSPGGIGPRITWNAGGGLPGRGVALVATGQPDARGSCTRFDYIGVLDPDVL